MRIVIAEDSALLRAGIERILTDAGHEVVAGVPDATSTFLTDGFFAAPDRSGRAVLRLRASDFAFTASARSLEDV